MAKLDYKGRPGHRSTIRAFFLEPVVSELLRQHAPLDRLLRKNGLARSDLRSPYARLSLKSYVELMEEAAKSLANPFLGLELGGKFSLQMLGPFFSLMLNARSLREILAMFERFQKAWQANTSVVVTQQDETSTYTYGIEDAGIWPRVQDAEFTIAAMVSLIRQLTSPKWSPVAVGFEHSLGSRERPLRAFFKSPVQGSMSFNTIAISNRDLDRPMRGSVDSNLEGFAKIAEWHLQDLIVGDAEEAASVADATLSCIARRLGHSPVEIDVIAKELNLSARTLRRKLEEEGASFRDLLQSQRRQKAERLLYNGSIQVSELADRLGYSDTATFSRAFKSWTGFSPKEFSRRGGPSSNSASS